MVSKIPAALAILLSANATYAWFRVACTTPLVQERVDPIVDPGVIGSNHVHTINGGSNFAANSTYDTLRASRCTNCKVSPQDMSAYWYPKLYFRDPKTKNFEPVSDGGLLIYYQNRGNGDKSNGGPGIKAFPPGFKMISGNIAARSNKYKEGEGSQGELAERAIQWSCLRYSVGKQGYDGHGFPTTNCESGLNARIHFPACWDGVHLDSPNHKSHVAFLSGLDNGACPPTHPVYLMKLFYEVTWDLSAFSSRWTEADGWPFVYATGDPTGYSWHGDFQNGWDTVALQNAIDYCNNPNNQTGSGVTEACPYLTVVPTETGNQCKIAPVVHEQIDGVLKKLPGCNPIQSGPGDATIYPSSKCPI